MAETQKQEQKKQRISPVTLTVILLVVLAIILGCWWLNNHMITNTQSGTMGMLLAPQVGQLSGLVSS